MRIKHYSIFIEPLEQLDWEALRNNEKEEAYYLPDTREKYLAKVGVNHPSSVTRAVIHACKKLGVEQVFSIGCGIAAQEYEIRKFSALHVTVSDYNDSVNRLKAFDLFDCVLQLDASTDPIPADRSTIVLFPRIDTEFDDTQLRFMFKKCSDQGVQYIGFMPAELLDLRILAAEIKTRLYSLFGKKKKVFCGYARSFGTFEKLWEPYYKNDREFRDGNRFFLLKLQRPTND